MKHKLLLVLLLGILIPMASAAELLLTEEWTVGDSTSEVERTIDVRGHCENITSKEHLDQRRLIFDWELYELNRTTKDIIRKLEAHKIPPIEEDAQVTSIYTCGTTGLLKETFAVFNHLKSNNNEWLFPFDQYVFERRINASGHKARLILNFPPDLVLIDGTLSANSTVFEPNIMGALSFVGGSKSTYILFTEADATKVFFKVGRPAFFQIILLFMFFAALTALSMVYKRKNVFLSVSVAIVGLTSLTALVAGLHRPASLTLFDAPIIILLFGILLLLAKTIFKKHNIKNPKKP